MHESYFCSTMKNGLKCKVSFIVCSVRRNFVGFHFLYRSLQERVPGDAVLFVHECIENYRVSKKVCCNLGKSTLLSRRLVLFFLGV